MQQYVDARRTISFLLAKFSLTFWGDEVATFYRLALTSWKRYQPTVFCHEFISDEKQMPWVKQLCISLPSKFIFRSCPYTCKNIFLDNSVEWTDDLFLILFRFQLYAYGRLLIQNKGRRRNLKCGKQCHGLLYLDFLVEEKNMLQLVWLVRKLVEKRFYFHCDKMYNSISLESFPKLRRILIKQFLEIHFLLKKKKHFDI